MTAIGEPNVTAIAFFAIFIVLSLGITVWASRRTRSRSGSIFGGRCGDDG